MARKVAAKPAPAGRRPEKPTGAYHFFRLAIERMGAVELCAPCYCYVLPGHTCPSWTLGAKPARPTLVKHGISTKDAIRARRAREERLTAAAHAELLDRIPHSDPPARDSGEYADRHPDLYAPRHTPDCPGCVNCGRGMSNR